MKNIKLFENHSQYEDFFMGDMLKPNVSYCVNENEVHYNPSVLPGNEEAWELFKLAFCENVTDVDKRIFAENIVSVSESFYDNATYGTKYTMYFHYTKSNEDRSRMVSVSSEWGTQEGANVDKTIYQCRGGEHGSRYDWNFTPTR